MSAIRDLLGPPSYELVPPLRVPATAAEMAALLERRPPIGTSVRVAFAGSEGFDPESITGTVDRYDDDSITLDDGNLTTVYDTQLADGSATLVVIR